MPPKKTATNSADASEGSGKFTWEGPNDFKLLLLTQGRYVKPEEYEQLRQAFTGTTSVGSIRNRISALRVKQRDLYEQLGWDLPEGGAGHSAKKTKKGGDKRGADDEGADPVTPTKKPRTKKAKKEKTVSSESEGEEKVEEQHVKKEVVEDEV